MIAEWARRHSHGATPREQAAALFYAVRDGFRYDPYRIDLCEHGMQPERVLENGYGWCVPKAALLSAACRALDIPARLGFADVRNHLTTPKLRQIMGTDVFAWHGFSEILLDGHWHRATPAFNRELCERAGVPPLEFGGAHDHLEYLRQHGSFAEIPLEQMRSDYRRIYPHWNLDDVDRLHHPDVFVDQNVTVEHE